VPRRATSAAIRSCIALAAIAGAGAAHAQLIDSVDVQRRGNEAAITIRFTTQVQYLRHAPLDFGAALRIYTQLTRPAVQENDLGQESQRLPETDLVPRFTLTYPEADGALSIAFDRPTRFTARGGDDGRSIVLLLPVLPKAQDWAVQMKGTGPEPKPSAQPVAAPAVAPAVPAARPNPPAALAAGRSIDSIDVQRLGKQAEIRIRFMMPVRLARATPPGTGNSVRIYPQAAQAGKRSDMQGREATRVEGIDLVPHFTASYPETDDSLLVHFDRSTPYSVAQGPDDRSISILVPALPGAKDLSLYVQGLPPPPLTASIRSVPAVAAPPAAPAASPATAAAPTSSAASTATAPAATRSAQTLPTAAAEPTPAARIADLGAAAAAAPIAAEAPAMAASSAAPIAASPAPVSAAETALPAAAVATAPALATLPSEAGPDLAPLSSDEIEARAKSAMVEAQRALVSRRGVIAGQLLGQVLALPPNAQTRLAQALMGEAREYSGELRKAKAEYELYLKRYPGGAETSRVQERLLALNKTLSQALAGGPGGTGLAKPAEWTVYGSVSQYSYRGNSQIETITPPPPGQLTFNSDKLALQDQNAIISTFDLNARKRDGARDTRIVIRDNDTHNYLYGQPQVNRLYSAYYEQSDKDVGYLVRGGRQMANGGGVFGRFDGIWAGYNLNPTWRVNGVVGTPVEFGTPLKRSVQGLSVDRIPQLGETGFSVYYVEQPLEGVNDRKAIGAEARYFDQRRTFYGMADYDVNFHSLNMAMAQGNWRTDAGTSYFANIDIRKTPPLGLLTAMSAQQITDPFTLLPVFLDQRTAFRTAVNTFGLGELRSQAFMLSGTSQMFSAGFMHPVTPRWQLGADYRLASVSGTGDVLAMPAQPASGSSNVVSGQALGTNLMLPNDTVVLNASLIDAPTSFGQSYNVSYVIPYNAWRFDAILRYYVQKDNQDQRQERIAPTLKIIYRWRNSVSFEFEAGNELFDETGPLREMHSRRRYFFGGYRWDFR
jgi:hypothetical protein